MNARLLAALLAVSTLSQAAHAQVPGKAPVPVVPGIPLDAEQAAKGAPAPPPPPPPANQTPLPSDAQCAPLPPVKLPLAFGPGETLEYDVDAMGAKAARMIMRTLPLKDGALPIEIDVATNTFFSKVRRVKGAGTSYVSPRTLKPQRYFEDATENEVHRVADVRFRPKDHVAHLMSNIDGTTYEQDLGHVNDALDVSGTIYYLRQMPLKAGQAMCFDAYGIRRMWRVWGKVVGREHVSLPVGEFEAWHIAGEAARLDLPAMRREIHVWISDDPRRLPLAALGSIDLGTVRATLTGITRPGEKQTEAETRANLKW
ncbi:MAG: DUF3108 domain-containing protein [Myxococcaceae bacterium]|nr:DUF3108 domain-containing protein [Myxococcaceae bacterium]